MEARISLFAFVYSTKSANEYNAHTESIDKNQNNNCNDYSEQ